jgi:hypothetical protein
MEKKQEVTTRPPIVLSPAELEAATGGHGYRLGTKAKPRRGSGGGRGTRW